MFFYNSETCRLLFYKRIPDDSSSIGIDDPENEVSVKKFIRSLSDLDFCLEITWLGTNCGLFERINREKSTFHSLLAGVSLQRFTEKFAINCPKSIRVDSSQ